MAGDIYILFEYKALSDQTRASNNDIYIFEIYKCVKHGYIYIYIQLIFISSLWNEMLLKLLQMKILVKASYQISNKNNQIMKQNTISKNKSNDKLHFLFSRLTFREIS